MRHIVIHWPPIHSTHTQAVHRLVHSGTGEFKPKGQRTLTQNLKPFLVIGYETESSRNEFPRASPPLVVHQELVLLNQSTMN